MSGLIKPIGKRKSNFKTPEEALKQLEDLDRIERERAEAEYRRNNELIDDTDEFVNGLDYIDDSLDDADEETDRPAPKINVKPLSLEVDAFFLEDAGDVCRIYDVKLDGKRYAIDWMKDRSSSATQDEHLETFSGGTIVLPSAKIYHATISALYDNQESNWKEQAFFYLKQMLARDIGSNPVMTSTKVIYKPTIDEVVHNCGYYSKHSSEADICGVDRKVEPGNTAMQPVMKALLGSDDLEQIKDMYNWLFSTTDFTPHLHGSVIRPDREVECPVTLFGSCNGMIFEANNQPSQKGIARGVIVHPMKMK